MVGPGASYIRQIFKCDDRTIARGQQELKNPAPSMDVKKKGLLGNFFRPGEINTQEATTVNDHDFPSLADGKVVSHGLYDIYRNIGYTTLGLSHETFEFAWSLSLSVVVELWSR